MPPLEKRSTLFVRDGEGRYFLPRPSSWMGGWARHLWFQHHVGKASIASPEGWKMITELWGVFRLVEYEDGTLLTEKIRSVKQDENLR